LIEIDVEEQRKDHTMDAPTLTKLVKELKELTDGENASKKVEVGCMARSRKFGLIYRKLRRF
jgi:hypothetical protein